MRHHYPVLAKLADDRSRSERVADKACEVMGSMRFIVTQSAVVALWIGLNIAGIALQWDPYPFIALNLLFSTQAAYAAPLILLAQRRADAKRGALADDHYRQEGDLRTLIDQNTALLGSSTTTSSRASRDRRNAPVVPGRTLLGRPARCLRRAGRRLRQAC